MCDKSAADHIQEHVYNEPGNNIDQVWRTRYDQGAWYMVVPEARSQDEIGVGQPGGVQVQIAHICKQDLIDIEDYEPCSVVVCK